MDDTVRNADVYVAYDQHVYYTPEGSDVSWRVSFPKKLRGGEHSHYKCDLKPVMKDGKLKYYRFVNGTIQARTLVHAYHWVKVG